MIDRSRFNDFKPTQQTGERQTLPAGVYEGHIIAAKVDTNNGGQTLIIQVEIDKGEYAGFFRKQYEAAQGGQFPAKYKGVLRVQLPDGVDPQHDGWRQHQLEGVVWALEDGNPGYHWDWDENKLKGLRVGLNVRERDYYYQGKSGTTTEIGRLESIAKLHSADPDERPKPMKKRELSAKDKAQKAQDQMNASGYVEVESEELPWA
jgi:hypothetical protein